MVSGHRLAQSGLTESLQDTARRTHPFSEFAPTRWKRNLMELPHEGITPGGDLLHGHRAMGPMGRRPRRFLERT